MEPQIIDYYNEMPSGINVINKMNEELDELQKKYNELEKKLESYEPSGILYSSENEWNNSLNQAYKIIKDGVDKWIVNDEFEYNGMRVFGLCPRQRMNISRYIEEGLYIIVKKSFPLSPRPCPWKKWVSRISYEIMYGIEAFINALMEINIEKETLWDIIYRTTTPQQLSDMIYKNIIWQLDEEDHYPCILSDLSKFKCSKCDEICDYVDSENKCVECD